MSEKPSSESFLVPELISQKPKTKTKAETETNLTENCRSLTCHLPHRPCLIACCRRDEIPIKNLSALSSYHSAQTTQGQGSGRVFFCMKVLNINRWNLLQFAAQPSVLHFPRFFPLSSFLISTPSKKYISAVVILSRIII